MQSAREVEPAHRELIFFERLRCGKLQVWLMSAKARHGSMLAPGSRRGTNVPRRIMGVTEPDGVIEGLPPSREETRRRIAEQLLAIDRTPAARLSAE
jgi:hypothetical protein